MCTGFAESEAISLLAQDITGWTRMEEALRNTRNELLRLSSQHLAVQENERQRIAADLHDGIGQSIGMMSLYLENISNLLQDGDIGSAARAVDVLKPRVKDMLEDVRRLAMNLRPATLDSIGVLATLGWYLRELGSARLAMRVERHFGIEEDDVPQAVKMPLFRIIQEACGNIVRHADASRVSVRLFMAGDVLELCVEDDGQGFDEMIISKRPTPGMGLRNMRERAVLSLGTYHLETTPGAGTRVRVRWPLSVVKDPPQAAWRLDAGAAANLGLESCPAELHRS